MRRSQLTEAAAALAENDADMSVCVACQRPGTALRGLEPFELGAGLGRASRCRDFRDCNCNQLPVMW